MSTAPVDTAVLDAQLPGWDYADAYDVMVDGDGPDSALTAIRCLSGSGPGRLMLRARDLLVSAVGLKPAVSGADELFPVLVDTPQLAVVGLDDSHLDFRILVRLDGRRVRCVTVVRRHNALGRAYFAVVRPFHRRLVPYLLARAAQRRWTTIVDSGQGRGARTHASAVNDVTHPGTGRWVAGLGGTGAVSRNPVEPLTGAGAAAVVLARAWGPR